MSDYEDYDIVNSNYNNNTSNLPEHGEILNSGRSTNNLSTTSHHPEQTVDTNTVSPVTAPGLPGPDGQASALSRIVTLLSEEKDEVQLRNSESSNGLHLHFHYQPIGQVIQDQRKTVETHDTHKTKIFNVANCKKVHFGKKVSKHQDKNANPTQASPHINETSTIEASTSTAAQSQPSSPSTLYSLLSLFFTLFTTLYFAFYSLFTPQASTTETTSSEATPKLPHSSSEQPQLGQQAMSSSLPSCSSSPTPDSEQSIVPLSSSSSEPSPPSSSMQQPTSSQRPMLKKESSHRTTPKIGNAQAQHHLSSSSQLSNMESTLSETTPKLPQSSPKHLLLHQQSSQTPCSLSRTFVVVETVSNMRHTIEILSGTFMQKLWNILSTKRKETETHQAMFVSIYNEAVDWFDSMPKPESPQLVNECKNGLDSLLKRMYEAFQIGFTAEELYEDALNYFKNCLKKVMPRFRKPENRIGQAREILEVTAKDLKKAVHARISKQCGKYFLKEGNGLIAAAIESRLRIVRGILAFFSPSRQIVVADMVAANLAHPSQQKAEFRFALAKDSSFEFTAEIQLELNFGKVIFLI